MSSFGRQFDFHDIIYHVQPCVMPFLQLMDVQNVCKNMHFSQNKSYGKF